MGLLDGRKAVVTGGASGIGRATARRMAEEGAVVAVIDLNGDAAHEVAKEIGGSAHVADVTDPDAMQDAFDAAVGIMGGLTVLFNNAGTGNQSPLHEWSLEEWNRLLAVNLTGVFLGFKAGIPHLRASGGGSIPWARNRRTFEYEAVSTSIAKVESGCSAGFWNGLSTILA